MTHEMETKNARSIELRKFISIMTIACAFLGLSLPNSVEAQDQAVFDTTVQTPEPTIVHLHVQKTEMPKSFLPPGDKQDESGIEEF